MAVEAKKTISKIKKIWQRLSNPAYREAYVQSSFENDLSVQIYNLRTSRGMTQKDLSEKVDMAQPRISVLETSCSNVSLNTLRRLAKAFDVALVVKFVSFSELIREKNAKQIDSAIPAFEDDSIEPFVQRASHAAYLFAPSPSRHYFNAEANSASILKVAPSSAGTSAVTGVIR